MMTELMLRERLGQSLPDGVALGPSGEPTREPSVARRGALLPFGGYKGFGLGLIVQALGVLAGSGLDVDGDNGYLFIVFKPDLLIPPEQAKRELAALIARIKANPRAPGVAEIRIPGERSARHRERALREGLEVDRTVVSALEMLCRA
jgi:L-2-hydroxycarboxylate dehydrogenase (NAD+)